MYSRGSAGPIGLHKEDVVHMPHIVKKLGIPPILNSLCKNGAWNTWFASEDLQGNIIISEVTCPKCLSLIKTQ